MPLPDCSCTCFVSCGAPHACSASCLVARRMPAPRCSSVNLPSSQGPSVLRPCPMCDDEPRLLRQFPLSPGHANTTCPLPLLFGAPLSLRPPPLAFPSRFLTSKPVAPQERVPANLHLPNVCNHTEQRGRATLSKQSQVWDAWLLQTARSRAVGATCQQAEAIVGWDPRHITVTKYCAFENTRDPQRVSSQVLCCAGRPARRRRLL